MTDLPLPALQPTQPERVATLPHGRWLRLWAYLTRPLRHAGRRRAQVLTPEEIALKQKLAAEAAQQRELEKKLDELAAHYKRLIINALTRVGVSHVTKEDGRRRVGQVEFYKPASVSAEAIYYQVKTTHLPWHINIDHLLEESTINTLTFATGRVIQIFCDRAAPEKGFWIIVELKSGVRGIPRLVAYAPLLAEMPKSASRYTVAVGRGRAGKPVFFDFTKPETPHLLIAGATGGGKTVALKQIILTLAMQNTPHQLQLSLVDLKDGTDLSPFKDLPHLLGHKIIKDVDAVAPLLNAALNTMKQRRKQFEDAGVDNIDTWNQRMRTKLPRIFIFIDELAEVMLTGHKTMAEQALARIAALGRSAGVHAVIATQRPSSDILTGLITANFSARLAFSCSSQRQSMVIIDTGDAAQLAPVGRMIFMNSSNKIELQSPLVSTDLITETVNMLAHGKRGDALATRKRHNYSWEDLCRHALQHYPGRFPIRPIYEDLKVHGVTKEELLKLAREHEGKEFEVDGDTYTLTPAVTEGAKESRQLIRLASPITDADDDGQPEDQLMPPDPLAAFQSIDVPDDYLTPPMPDAATPPEDTDPSEDDPD